jgi:hypothetical protein
MGAVQENKAPLKLRIQASIVGGIVGALNPAVFVFNPAYIERIQSRFDFNYPAYATTLLVFFLFLLFIPCTLSTFSLYPWLYKRLSTYVAEGRIPKITSYIKLGTLFGCMATFVTAFFLIACMVIFNFLNAKPMDSTQVISMLFGGTFLLGIAGILFLPMIIISGSLFAWGNYLVIKPKK